MVIFQFEATIALTDINEYIRRMRNNTGSHLASARTFTDGTTISRYAFVNVRNFKTLVSKIEICTI